MGGSNKAEKCSIDTRRCVDPTRLKGAPSTRVDHNGPQIEDQAKSDEIELGQPDAGTERTALGRVPPLVVG